MSELKGKTLKKISRDPETREEIVVEEVKVEEIDTPNGPRLIRSDQKEDYERVIAEMKGGSE